MTKHIQYILHTRTQKTQKHIQKRHTPSYFIPENTKTQWQSTYSTFYIQKHRKHKNTYKKDIPQVISIWEHKNAMTKHIHYNLYTKTQKTQKHIQKRLTPSYFIPENTKTQWQSTYSTFYTQEHRKHKNTHKKDIPQVISYLRTQKHNDKAHTVHLTYNST